MEVGAAPGSLLHLGCALERFVGVDSLFVFFASYVEVGGKGVVDAYQFASVAAVYYRVVAGVDGVAVRFCLFAGRGRASEGEGVGELVVAFGKVDCAWVGHGVCRRKECVDGRADIVGVAVYEKLALGTCIGHVGVVEVVDNLGLAVGGEIVGHGRYGAVAQGRAVFDRET